MKNSLSLCVLALSLSFSTFAQDRMGGTDGGGGRGVVCYADANQKVIESVELLDFYEGRLLEGYNISEQHGSFNEIYREMIKKSASKSILQTMEYGEKLLKGFKFLSTGVRLKPVDDSGEIFIPANCKIEQVANFQGLSRIFIVKDFWDYLSETSKAGLLMHELIWFVDRSAGAEISSRARRTVARFFADNYEFHKVVMNPKVGDWTCASSNPNHRTNDITAGNTFILSQIPNTDNCELRFGLLNSSLVFTEAKAIYEDCSELQMGGTYEDDMWDRNLTTTLEVISTNDEVVTHDFTWIFDIKYVRTGNTVEIVRKDSIRISNREFPGYDQKEVPLQCYQLDEEDISEGNWDNKK